MLGRTSTQGWKPSESCTHVLEPVNKRSLTKMPESSDIEQIWQLSWRKTFYRGGPVFMSALAGIDIALWDLKGEFA